MPASRRTEVEFLGAAETVTGSMHLVRTPHGNVLLDCGLFQGRRREAFERNRNLPVRPADVGAVVLSHAHIDHSGALPCLVKAGYRGPIFTTAATRDLCAAMLEDAAMIQEADARYLARLHHEHPEVEPVEPLFLLDDVVTTLDNMVAVPYRREREILPGLRLTLYDAGHVLGSALVALDVQATPRQKRLLFSGDLGRRAMPILRDPEIPHGVCALILESTYGDRLHPQLQAMEDELAAVITRTTARGGKVIIPSFALERAQEVLFVLKRLERAGRLPKVPIYVDSPLTVKVTDVFKLHPECYDKETRALLAEGDSPFELDRLRYVTAVDDSKAIDAADGPAVIISASGMCEAGRVLHHLRATIGDARHSIVIVGFQAQHTLGRRLVERRPKVRIFGLEHDSHAEVVALNGFSAHADQADLVHFTKSLRAQGPLEMVALVHGEPRAQTALRDVLAREVMSTVRIPRQGERLTLWV